MKVAWKRTLRTALVALVMVSGIASVALAAPGENSGLSAPKGPNPHVVLAYVAGKAEVPMGQLVEEYRSGKTLVEICAAYGVDWSVIEDLIGPGMEQRIERLQEHIARLTERQGKVQENLTKAAENVARLQEKIPNIEDPVWKGFAERQLDILQQRIELGTEKLGLIGEQLELLQDMLEYAQSL